MPPENIQNHKFSVSVVFFRIVGIIVLIIIAAFLIFYFFKNNNSIPQGLTETEREAFLNQEIDENAVGLTDEEKQAFFNSSTQLDQE